MNVDIQNSKTGVSPVIGVVLMVAITVILAAVVGSFALGLVGSQQQNPNAAVSFEQTPYDPTERTNVSSRDLDGDGSNNAYAVEMRVVTVENADSLTVSSDGQGTFTDSAGATRDVVTYTNNGNMTQTGDTVTAEGLDQGDQVTVTGQLDGKEVVLQTYTVN